MEGAYVISNCTVYIDEAGDLGVNRGTKWFILTGVLVERNQEKSIRGIISNIKTRLNKKYIHFRDTHNFEAKCYIVNEISKCDFIYFNVIVDTSLVKIKPESKEIKLSSLIYNYACKYLLERISTYLTVNQLQADIVLSSRGSQKDKELIAYITDKLLPYEYNCISECCFNKVKSLNAEEWDMLQLADVCATSTFYLYEPGGYGFVTPCFSIALSRHLYRQNGVAVNYGLKYFSYEMRPTVDYFNGKTICNASIKKEPPECVSHV